MGQALYRKYRSRTLKEVVGQKHITDTLDKALKTGKISHAYLFTGPRGVGKTSVARILAHEVNALPYKDDSVHFDIIEIDAASNRRIDEIRDLRDKVHIAPTSAKYKVYIIDEVHMLTREAFNALLKTLEEPPAHCIFILATTEEHKLPETIVSRTQRFTFKPVSMHDASGHLAELAKKEKIDITADALNLLAEHGQGSFRDSISLLDQLATHSEKITEEKIRETLGLPTETTVKNLLNLIKGGNTADLIKELDTHAQHGINPVQIAAELGKLLRTELINGSNDKWIPKLLRMLLDVSASQHPKETLEISMLEITSQNDPEPKKEANITIKPEVITKTKQKQGKTIVAEVQTNEPSSEAHEFSKDFDLALWPNIVSYSKEKNASLYTALKLAKPSFLDATLTLAFQFPLHQKKLSQAKQRDQLSQVIQEVTQCVVRIECVVDRTKFKTDLNIPAEANIDIQKVQPGSKELKSISNIFGNAEVLES